MEPIAIPHDGTITGDIGFNVGIFVAVGPGGVERLEEDLAYRYVHGDDAVWFKEEFQD